MRTVGIDLAAGDAGTAVCVIAWADGLATVEELSRGSNDGELVAVCVDTSVAKVGVDCPFGWPEPFVDAMTDHRTQRGWPGPGSSSPEEFNRSLRYRTTDLHVHRCTGTWPLSVSTDRIGVTAMRCASLLDTLVKRQVPVDRVGTGKVMEVYPAAALGIWHVRQRGYKKPTDESRTKLAAMVDALRKQLPGLRLDTNHEALCRTSHDAFDALVSALVARAGALSLTVPPQTDEQRRIAATEGWIHLPRTEPRRLLAG